MFEKPLSRLLAGPCWLSLLIVPAPAAKASPSLIRALPDAALGMAASEPSARLASARLEESFGQLPLYFVENHGQLDERVAYYLLGSGTRVYFAADGVTFGLLEPGADEARDPYGRGEAVPSQHDLVYAYDALDTADHWKKYDPNAPPPANDLHELGPGKGYWLRMTAPATLVVGP